MRPAMSIGKVLAVGAALVAGLAVAASIWLNPPAENRARAMDSQRLWRISRIESAINNHYRLHQKLPANLEELTHRSCSRKSARSRHGSNVRV